MVYGFLKPHSPQRPHPRAQTASSQSRRICWCRWWCCSWSGGCSCRAPEFQSPVRWPMETWVTDNTLACLCTVHLVQETFMMAKASTYCLRQEGYVFGQVCPFVCWFVCLSLRNNYWFPFSWNLVEGCIPGQIHCNVNAMFSFNNIDVVSE